MYKIFSAILLGTDFCFNISFLNGQIKKKHASIIYAKLKLLGKKIVLNSNIPAKHPYKPVYSVVYIQRSCFQNYIYIYIYIQTTMSQYDQRSIKIYYVNILTKLLY
jgi:hypothetical protein